MPDRLSGAAKIFGEAGIPKKVLNELERSRDTMKREGRNHMLRWLDIVRRMPSRIHHQEAVDGFALECVLEELDATGGVWLPCEEQTCAERVRRFGDFANAYTQYLDFWKADLHRGLTRDKRLTARKVKYRKCVELDCWLILVWPVVIEHQWTYSDVERVRRMRFEGREPDECERVLRADREKIKQRCERLSLHIATSRGRPRNYANPPAMLQLAMQIRA